MFVRKKGKGITQLKYLKTFNHSGSLTTVCSPCDFFLRAADASWKKLWKTLLKNNFANVSYFLSYPFSYFSLVERSTWKQNLDFLGRQNLDLSSAKACGCLDPVHYRHLTSDPGSVFKAHKKCWDPGFCSDPPLLLRSYLLPVLSVKL